MKVDSGLREFLRRRGRNGCLHSGTRRRAQLTRKKAQPRAVTIAVSNGSGFTIQDVDFDDIDWLEVDGPCHPRRGHRMIML